MLNFLSDLDKASASLVSLLLIASLLRMNCLLFYSAKEAGATWSTKQGRSAFLAISLKESCSSMLAEDYKAKIFQQVLAYVNTDRVSFWQLNFKSGPNHLIDFGNATSLQSWSQKMPTINNALFGVQKVQLKIKMIKIC